MKNYTQKNIFSFLLTICLLSPAIQAAQICDSVSSKEILSLYEADQADRVDAAKKKIPWDAVWPRDRARLTKVKLLDSRGEICSADDFKYSAFIAQHGESFADSLMAVRFASVAKTLNPGSQVAKWIYAAAIDRLLIKAEGKQLYGTQMEPINGKLKSINMIKDAVSDEEKRQAGIVPEEK